MKFVRIAAAAFCVGALTAGCAGTLSSEIVNPSWADAVDPESLVFPPIAAAMGFNGSVVVECVAMKEGAVVGCMALEEQPMGMGFGPSAIASMRGRRIHPRTVDGEPMDSRIRSTVRFQLGTDEDDSFMASLEGEATEEPADVDGPTPTVAVSERPEEPDPDDLETARQALWLMMLGQLPYQEVMQEHRALLLNGLPADRVERVEVLVRQAESEARSEFIDHMARIVAQTATAEQFAAMRAGQSPATWFDQERMAARMDPADMLELGRAFSDILRSLYCAEFDCVEPDLPEPPVTAVSADADAALEAAPAED